MSVGSTAATEPCIYLVDDDRSVLTGLSRLLTSAGYSVKAFDSPEEFLRQHDPELPGCVLLDIGMGELDGLSLHARLSHEDSRRAVIFITGRDDARTGVFAMKAGALDYLTKPVQDAALLASVATAIDFDQRSRSHRAELLELQRMFRRLTAREAEVLGHVVRGRLNKQIAYDLGIVEKTVKVHRARLMEKLHARSVAELVRIGERLGIGANGADA
jgi:FixJ family two-component response regulator